MLRLRAALLIGIATRDSRFSDTMSPRPGFQLSSRIFLSSFSPSADTSRLERSPTLSRVFSAREYSKREGNFETRSVSILFYVDIDSDNDSLERT